MQAKDAISLLLRALGIVVLVTVAFSLAISIRAQNGHSVSERLLLQEQRMLRNEQDVAGQAQEIIKLRDEIMALRNSLTKLETSFYIVSGLLTLILGSQLYVQIRIKVPAPKVEVAS